MNIFSNISNYPYGIGSVLARPKSLVTHKAIYVGDGKVAELIPSGTKIRTLKESFRNIEPQLIKSGLPKEELPGFYKRLEEATSENNSYSVIFNNCEHFVNFVRDGIKSSAQVKAVCLLALGIFFACASSRKR